MDTMTASSPVTLKPYSVNRFSLPPSSITHHPVASSLFSLIYRLKRARLNCPCLHSLLLFIISEVFLNNLGCISVVFIIVSVSYDDVLFTGVTGNVANM